MMADRRRSVGTPSEDGGPRRPWHDRPVSSVLAVVIVLVAVALVVAVALGVVGREVALLADRAQPSVFEMEEAVAFIAERLPAAVAGRITHDDLRWILRADADALERFTDEQVAEGDVDLVIDEVDAVARVLARVEEERPDLDDADVAAVLDARTVYLRAIGAIGVPADDVDVDTDWTDDDVDAEPRDSDAEPRDSDAEGDGT
mgnify:CR=1 FL=1